jgi:hypothetical protein
MVGRRPSMLVERVPQREASARPGGVIPGYDEGLVNKDAVVDAECARRGELYLWSIEPSNGRVSWRASDETRGQGAALKQFAFQACRLTPSLARSHARQAETALVWAASAAVAAARAAVRASNRVVRSPGAARQM